MTKWLYHKDENDNIRMWKMEINGDEIRSVSGIKDGQFVTSTWKKIFPKNVGKSNATTAEEQAIVEVQALYKKRLELKYFESEDQITGKRKILQPMLARKYEGDLDYDNIYTQPKLDGARCIITRNGMVSRAGKSFVSVPHIFDGLKFLFESYPDLILDGELYNHDLKEDFNKIMSLIRKTKPTETDIEEARTLVEYHIYDIVSDEPFEVRLTNMRATQELTSHLEFVKYVDTFKVSNSQELDAKYASFLESGYEGQMIRLNQPYEFKRSNNLLKRKEFIDEEFEVESLQEGQGNWAGYYKIANCRLSDGRVFGAGIKGNQEYTRGLMFKPKPKLATIRYQNLTPDGIPRFPIAVNFFWGDRDI